MFLNTLQHYNTCGVVMVYIRHWSCLKYQETPTKINDFHILPVEQGWQDTIHFKEEGHKCSILKRFIFNCIPLTRNSFKVFHELPHRGGHP